MKHTAVITYHRATCSCGQMQGVWRETKVSYFDPEVCRTRTREETVGDFTKRAYSLWEQHRDTAEMPIDLFDYRQPVETVEQAQGGLFA